MLRLFDIHIKYHEENWDGLENKVYQTVMIRNFLGNECHHVNQQK